MSDYRYTLTRDLDEGRDETMCWVMLNPSTADDTFDDPTIRRVKSFTAREGFRHLIVVNLFAQRATDPGRLVSPTDEEFARNRLIVRNAITPAAMTVCAWGASSPKWMLFSKGLMVGAVKTAAVRGPLMCLGRTADGSPRHPLYVRADQPLETYP